MQTNDSLTTLLNRTHPVKPDDDEEDVGRCAAIAKSRWITALTIKHATKPWESFQYRHIGVRSTFEPTRFEVFFVGDEEKWKVVVTGRNLERIYHLVVQGRMEWLAAADRDFAGDKEPIILSIVVEKVQETKT